MIAEMTEAVPFRKWRPRAPTLEQFEHQPTGPRARAIGMAFAEILEVLPEFQDIVMHVTPSWRLSRSIALQPVGLLAKNG
jgi:hypothetical protein